MLTLIDWILDLFRSEDAARAFVAAPEQAMRDAGLTGVTAAQLSSVAATAVPGLVLGNGDPIVGLQRAVSNQYGFAPSYTPSFDPIWAPAPTYAPAPVFAPSPTFAPETTTDLASHNDTALFSPPQEAGANAQQGAFNLGFGDITLGDKTSQTATNGGVVVGADASGDIVSGDGAVLGNANSVTNGDIRADQGSNVSTGEGAVIRDSGTTAGSDSTVHNGNAIGGTTIGGSQTTTTVGGTGNTTTADGHAATTTTVTHTTTTTETTDSSDNSVTTVTDSSTHDSSSRSLFDNDLMSNNDTALHNDTALASGNHLGGLLGF